MRQRLGDGTYANLEAMRKDLDTLVSGWALAPALAQPWP